jgi:SAM-dependent methyltransferase
MKAVPEQRTYFSHVRHDLVAHLGPAPPSNVLDVGCADGTTGALIKSRYPGCRVVGVERDLDAARQAEQKLDRVVTGDLNQLPLPFSPGEFDYVLLGDVLEHLVDPWRVLRELGSLARREGYVIATIPNVRNWRVVRDLALRGRWEYQREGILDRTHLRFFTRRGVADLFEGAGLSIRTLDAMIAGKSRVANLLTFGLFADLLAPKYLVKAQRSARP